MVCPKIYEESGRQAEEDKRRSGGHKCIDPSVYVAELKATSPLEDTWFKGGRISRDRLSISRKIIGIAMLRVPNYPVLCGS